MIYYLGLLHQRDNNTIKLVPATNLEDLSVYKYSTYSFIKSIFEYILFGIKLYNNNVLIFSSDKTKANFFPLQVTIMATLQVSEKHFMANRTWKLKNLPNLPGKG